MTNAWDSSPIVPDDKIREYVQRLAAVAYRTGGTLAVTVHPDTWDRILALSVTNQPGYKSRTPRQERQRAKKHRAKRGRR